MAYRASPQSGVQLVRDAPRVGRVTRSPEHIFRIRSFPWQIQPFFIAPVLPGETMKNLLINARARSIQMMADPMQGWWHETYFFYVKHRDLPHAEAAMALHLDASAPITDLDTGIDPWMGHHIDATRVNWVRECLTAVVNEYFRDEDETAADGTFLGVPLAHLNMTGLLQSAVLDLVGGADLGDHALPGEEEYDVAKYANIPVEFQSMYRAWEDMTAMKLTTATFEDYLKSFGVRPPKETRVEEIAKPELIRYIRQWEYPQVALADTGTGGYQFRLDIQERADKDRFFAEPGFLFGVMVARPKVMLAEQMIPGVSILDDAYGWLPAVLREEAYTSLVKFDVSTSGGATDGHIIERNPDAHDTNPDYWVDRKDLFVHGDQFSNMPLQVIDDTLTPDAYVQTFGFAIQAVDAADYRTRYPVRIGDALNGLFAGGLSIDPEDPEAGLLPENGPLEVDGIVRPAILSRVEDTSL